MEMSEIANCCDQLDCPVAQLVQLIFDFFLEECAQRRLNKHCCIITELLSTALKFRLMKKK